MNKGFDTERYVKKQTEFIRNRVSQFDGRLYLEFGGKLIKDLHAARVLPGYEPDAKICILRQLKDKSEFFYCVNAKDIERGKIKHDFGLSYDQQALNDIQGLWDRGVKISGIVITRYDGEKKADMFREYMVNLGFSVYLHNEIEEYPMNLDKVVGENGYGEQTYIPVEKPLVIITGAGGGSGKMSVCLAQIYHESKRGMNSGYAKFETFPIWNIPIDHPVNIAYEAATADIGDIVMLDQFHLEAYNEIATNYNRDLENFILLKSIIKKISGSVNHVSMYKSPTDMGVNMVAEGIIDDEIIREAAKQEIIRRFFRYKKERIQGFVTKDTVKRAAKLMQKVAVEVSDRKTVAKAREAAKQAREGGKGNDNVYCGAAIELPDGQIITGKNSPLLHAESAAVLNAIKIMADIPDDIDLIPSKIIQNINDLKENVSGKRAASLNLEETLITLAISAATNPMAEVGLTKLRELADCEMHITHIPSHGDEGGLRKLRIHYTTDAQTTFNATVMEEGNNWGDV